MLVVQLNRRVVLLTVAIEEEAVGTFVAEASPIWSCVTSSAKKVADIIAV